MRIHIKNILFICVALPLLFSTTALGQKKIEWLNSPVTIRFQEETMNSVLGKISGQTGVAILYDEKLADQKVTGHYKSIKFSEAIDRLFSGTNKSIQVLESEKKLLVKTFGAKNYISSNSVSSVVDKAENSLSHIKKMRNGRVRSEKKHQAYLNDPNAIDPFTGRKLTEIQLQNEQAAKRYNEYLKNPDSVDPLTGRKLTEIRLQNEQAAKRYNEYLKNPDSVDPFTGRKLHVIQGTR